MSTTSPTRTTNVINAICNLISLTETHGAPLRLSATGVGRYNNAINSVGESFEDFIRHSFANSFGLPDEEKARRWSSIYSYIGGQNNPPDLMIRGGDAVEIKKIGSIGGSIQLNSSMPEQVLRSDSPMLTNECRNSEVWNEKPLLYVIGTVQQSLLTHISMVYGSEFCSTEASYRGLRDLIANEIGSLDNISLVNSREIAHVANIDPLNITSLRVRGMWTIDNPINVFNYVYSRPTNCAFSLMFLVSRTRWDNYMNNEQLINLAGNPNIDGERLKIKYCRIKAPDNPQILKDAVLVTYWR